MNNRFLGKSGISVFPVGIGCWSYGGGAYWGNQAQSDVEKIVSAGLDYGMNFFDTAEMYNDGASESSLGEALGKRRHEAVVSSKISPQNCRKGMIREHCENSLRRLRTDYLDCYLIHWPFERHSLEHFTRDEALLKPINQEEAFDEFNKLKQEGKIRSLGVSNFGVQQLSEAIAAGAVIDVNEITYNLFSRAIERSILPFCVENGISIVGSMALQQGILADIYPDFSQIPAAQAHSRHFSASRGGEYSRHHSEGAEEEMREAMSGLREIAAQQKVSMAQLAIAWVLAKEGIASTLVGARNIHELESNYQAGKLVLDPQIKAQMDTLTAPVWKKLGNSADVYEDESRIY